MLTAPKTIRQYVNISKMKYTNIHPETLKSIDRLKELKDGWLEGHGKAPKHEGLDWIIDVLELEWGFNDLPTMYFTPTYEGYIECEWSNFPTYYPSLEINLWNRTGYWHNVNRKTKTFEEQYLNLQNPFHWQYLRDEITKAYTK